MLIFRINGVFLGGCDVCPFKAYLDFGRGMYAPDCSWGDTSIGVISKVRPYIKSVYHYSTVTMIIHFNHVYNSLARLSLTNKRFTSFLHGMMEMESICRAFTNIVSI